MRRRLMAATVLSLVAVIGFSLSYTPRASAAYFNHNRIIDDVIFDNSTSMTAAQINNFLNAFPNSCISPNSGFAAILPTGYNPNNGFSYGGFVSAGEVIYQAAVVYGINPQVLIATLQKEQSLVIGGSGYCENGDPHKYAAAAGYGCPDGGTRYSYSGVNLYRRNGVVVSAVNPTCVNSASKAGFSQQVIRAAWLLKFGQQRSKGNVNWAVVHGSWDNSDDPESCYSGPMTEGVYAICPSGSAVYYSGISNIDGTGVRMESGATAALYWYTPHFHGNQMFTDFFTDWFGNPTLPSAFKTSGSGAVYILVNGYKVVVPSMGLLQDYGISPGSIQTISQASFNAIPVPDEDSGISPVLSYLVKSASDQDADGGAVYVISIGQKNPIISMQQFNDFGFDANTISYLPLGFIQALAGSQNISNFIRLPDGAIFHATGGKKHWIFDQATYAAANPSLVSTNISAYTGNAISSGIPEVSYPVLIRNTIGTVFLLTSNTYYTLPSNDVYNCWGFGTALATPIHFLSDSDGSSSYVAPYTSSGALGCIINNGSTNYLLNNTAKLTIPGAYGISTATTTANVLNVANNLPTRQNALKQYIKGKNTPAIWSIESGSKRAIPSLLDFSLLNLTLSDVDIIEDGAAAIPTVNGVKLGTGRPVKADNSGAVSIISGNNRIDFANPEDFRAYGYDWPEIASFPASTLNTQYSSPSGTNVSRFLYVAAADKYYDIEPQGCYQMSPSLLSAYGKDSSAIAAAQTFSNTIFYRINPNYCAQGSVYAKALGQDTIYWINGGQKRPFASWNALVTHSNSQNPPVSLLLPSTLQPLTAGAPIY